MKLAYTHQNLFLVNHVRALLEAEGIDVEVRNTSLGGACGELPVFETWPEVWVREDADLARARGVIDALQTVRPGDDWVCGGCGEVNPGPFEFCWRCQFPRA